MQKLVILVLVGLVSLATSANAARKVVECEGINELLFLLILSI
jgi:hypothetical protein